MIDNSSQEQTLCRHKKEGNDPDHDPPSARNKKGRLKKAGCFLPLSRNPDISKTLGTRHQAAIGLTELVDAVAIVVSEETGKISVVVGGRITRDLDSSSLKRVLKRLLEPRTDKKKKR